MIGDFFKKRRGGQAAAIKRLKSLVQSEAKEGRGEGNHGEKALDVTQGNKPKTNRCK